MKHHDELANQALHELHLSRERGEPEYTPRQSGWGIEHPFNVLTEYGEAKFVRREPPRSYRITLLGAVVHKRLQQERQK